MVGGYRPERVLVLRGLYLNKVKLKEVLLMSGYEILMIVLTIIGLLLKCFSLIDKKKR